METKFNFKSQICTDIIQSERLLSLGLKKETADMCYKVTTHDFKGNEINEKDRHYTLCCWYDESSLVCGLERKETIPAWSLHMLLSLLPKYIRVKKESFGRFRWTTLELTIDAEFVVWYREDIDNSEVDENFYAEDIYTSLCNCIEWLINGGYFPKEYLV